MSVVLSSDTCHPGSSCSLQTSDLLIGRNLERECLLPGPNDDPPEILFIIQHSPVVQRVREYITNADLGGGVKRTGIYGCDEGFAVIVVLWTNQDRARREKACVDSCTTGKGPISVTLSISTSIGIQLMLN
ncbi:hypothetical protein ARMGADRAFT_1035881 [Armillaria gallica]|uniref:Uncharacterized protein n=1 Tax=Armillaria gallica TaxID=47427 RepID=A0A2H3DFB8_ARMGA|nr:hypothetical protein ARMGADRAFT_1035881 [Armillaria gallica]